MATSEAFGTLTRLELTAAAACVTYVERTQIGKRPPLSPPLRESAGATMAIDQATRGNLELMRTLSGERRGSLLEAIDRTRDLGRLAAAGATTVGAAHRSRGDRAPARCGGEFCRGRPPRAPIPARACKRRPISPARWRVWRSGAAARAISPPSATACWRPPISPARLASLKDAPAEIAEALQACRRPDGMLAAELAAALAAELPAFKRDGGFVREGYDAALDETRALRDESRRVVAALQARYADETGVRGLKIRHNNVLGYFVEVTAQHGDKLLAAPLNATFIHRQTLAGQVRFTTTELGELEAKIASAADRALGLELEIFERLAAAVIAQSARDQAMRRGARRASMWPARSPISPPSAITRARRSTTASTSSSTAAAIRWSSRRCRATARPSSPMIATCRRRRTTQAGRIWLITGPNMAGKSTFLRQNALIAILAQMGSFVPANIGAVSAWSTGCSRASAPPTIWRAAARPSWSRWWRPPPSSIRPVARSLVILDEIGRGTATFDGLSIAWATVEHLHDVNRCRALFATHFHELTALAGTARAPAQRHGAGEGMAGRRGVPARSRRRARPTAPTASRSRKLAGLPASVIERAKLVLAKLEQEDRAAPKGFEDLPLFAAPLQAVAGNAGRRARTGDRRGRRAQSGRDVAARGDGSALYVEGRS